MAKMVITKSLLTNIANAIREKTGKTAEITPAEMATEIEGIETGGVYDFLYKVYAGEITELVNDTLSSILYGLFAYASKLVSATFSVATGIGNHAFDYCSNLTNINFPAATTIGDYAFDGCSNLASIELPKATNIGNYAFYGCSNLTSIELPRTLYIGNYAFYGCSNLASIELPRATTIGKYAFDSCSNLTSIELPRATTIRDFAFTFCDSLKVIKAPKLYMSGTQLLLYSPNVRVFDMLGSVNYDIPSTSAGLFMSSAQDVKFEAWIIRQTKGVQNIPDAANIICGKGSRISKGTGYIYVPSALIEDYESETNWSVLAGQFRAIEDYTVDGTLTGDMDYDKMGVNLDD